MKGACMVTLTEWGVVGVVVTLVGLIGVFGITVAILLLQDTI